MSNDNPFANQGQPQGYGPPQPQYQAPKSNTLMIILIVIAAGSIPTMCICAGLLLPAVQAGREAARRMNCSNNMKQISIAMHNYHSAYKSLPPAYTVDARGRPLRSWRTLLLPFMEQQALYKQIDLTKPWDDPVNQMAAQTVVSSYSCPSTELDPTMTTVVAVVDPSGMMTGSTPSRFRDAVDGLAGTLVFVETDSAHAVPWMSPDDIDIDVYLNHGTARHSGGHAGGAHVIMGDGMVTFLTDSIDPEMRKALLTKAGGEMITDNCARREGRLKLTNHRPRESNIFRDNTESGVR